MTPPMLNLVDSETLQAVGHALCVDTQWRTSRYRTEPRHLLVLMDMRPLDVLFAFWPSSHLA